MVKSTKPVIAVCAVRTGAGKSQTSRKIQTMLREAGKKVVSIRHPMPYGDLAKQAVQRYRHDRRPQEARLHDRGDGGVRAPRRGRQRDLRRCRLRGHPARGREGGRRHPLGRRQQRLQLLQARPVRHRRRPAASRRRAALLPRRGQPAPRRRRRDQQDRQRRRRRHRGRARQRALGQSTARRSSWAPRR